MLNAKKKLSGKVIALLCSVAVIITLLIVATATGGVHNIVTCPTCNGTGQYNGKECFNCEGALQGIGSIWALLPPIIAIGLALITKEVYSSLFIGILSG
ncbi:MAG: hypothetical protein IKB30_04135, partial [Clostridia bacterium]|nr:hypothetical protein [Clostridia bacterium]